MGVDRNISTRWANLRPTVIDAFNFAKSPSAEAGAAIADKIFKSMSTEPWRVHHDGRHLVECLEMLPVFDGEAGCDSALAVIALIFHDAVCNPQTRGNLNELASAQLMVSALEALMVPPDVIGTAAEIVMSTAEYWNDGFAPTPTMRVVRDSDLWILGSAPERYAIYAEAVEREFVPVVGTDLYLDGRLDFLRGVKRRSEEKGIYATSAGRRQFEKPALDNLVSEIKQLEGRVSPRH